MKVPNFMVLCKDYFTCFVQIKVWVQKVLRLAYWQFLEKINFFETNERFFQKLESSLEMQRAKEKCSDNPGHGILELDNVLVQV